VFRNSDGECESGKIAEMSGQPISAMEDMCIYPYSEGGVFWVGLDFGCVHHKEN